MKISFKQFQYELGDLVERFRSSGWPAMVIALMMVLSASALGGAWYFKQQLSSVGASVSALNQKKKSVATAEVRQPEQAEFPPDSAYLDDLAKLFKVASKADVTLGVVEYRSEKSAKLPLIVRMVEFKVRGEYPKIKGFIAQALEAFPYLTLQEVRVERADGSAVVGGFLIRFQLIYRTADVTEGEGH